MPSTWTEIDTIGVSVLFERMMTFASCGPTVCGRAATVNEYEALATRLIGRPSAITARLAAHDRRLAWKVRLPDNPLPIV
jgi:hypothetical protein